MDNFSTTPQGISFKVLVQPKSSKNLIVGKHDDALKIKIKAPPVEGEANKMCIKFLSKTLKIPQSAITITAGQSSRNKHLLIEYPDGYTENQKRALVEALKKLYE